VRGGSPPVNVMYLFLLVFGALLSLAGVILAASGLSIHDHTFDAGLMTAGIVAVVGGLLLVGLGLALRVLQRIEQALEMRPPVPREATLEPAAAVAAETPSEAARIPFPLRISRAAQTAEASEPAAFAEKHSDELPLKFPKVARAGPAPAPDDVEPSKPPLPATAHDAEERPGERAGALFSRTLRGRNGAAPAPRLSPRLDPSARAPLSTQRPVGPAFDALWPKGSRRAARAQSAAVPELPATAGQPSVPERAERIAPELAQETMAQQSVVQEPAQEPAAHESVVSAPAARERGVAALPAVASNVPPEEAPEPITVLKSGIVDGMAYTLYSDGSIEAQLPQGLLRFGSISELRAHIEQDTQSS
jgi:hypothetical protein